MLVGKFGSILIGGSVVSKKLCMPKLYLSQYNSHLRNLSTIVPENNDSNIIPNEDEVYLDSPIISDEEVKAKTNKSRLNPAHRNMLHGKVPYSEPMNDIHHTIQYKRRMFGRYGKESNLNPGTLWPTNEELNETFEYEKVAYPFTIQEMVEKAEQKLQQEKRELAEKQLKIEKNLEQLDNWKKDIANRVAKKLADVAAAKAKKDALIEEVRRYFGYNVDPKDEKFKEMLAQKEKEQKKKRKEERAKVREQFFLSSLNAPGSTTKTPE